MVDSQTRALMAAIIFGAGADCTVTAAVRETDKLIAELERTRAIDPNRVSGEVTPLQMELVSR